MKNRLYFVAVLMTVIFALLIGEALAAPTTLGVEAGMSAYANVEAISDLGIYKPAFQSIEYETSYVLIGIVDMAPYADEYDPYVLVNRDGLILAYYPAGDPAAKMVDVIGRQLDETLLEKAVEAVGTAGGYSELAVSHYDFAQPDATKLLLVAEYQADGNAFTFNMSSSNIYHEKSYGFYRAYEPSFTLDNDSMEQVNFVLTNADYVQPSVYGTIYGHFGADPLIDFVTDTSYTFTVWNRDFYAFGALALLYSGDGTFSIADADYTEEIALTDPGEGGITFDLTPSAPDKISPTDGEIDVVLNPILSWNPSTAPNYEYCITTTEPADTNPLTDDCDTSWVNTGSATSVALSNLFYETTYFWQVRAVNSTETVEANGGTWFSFTTADGVAPIPFAKVDTTLSEPIDSLSKVTMTWEPSYGAYYYEVCVDTSAECIAPELWHNVGLATSATIGDLLLDSTYYWQVRAWNGFDNLGTEDPDYYTYSDGGWISFETRTFSKLRPLYNEVYNITLPFKWEATPIATNGYEYCITSSVPADIDPLTDDCDTKWNKVTDTSVVVKKLTAGTYYWQVRASGTQVEANDGEWWEFSVLAKRDVSKINLFKVSPVDGAVNQPISDLVLSWKATKTATGYEYCYFPIDDTDTTPISDDDTCSYDDANWVPEGTTNATISVDLAESTTYYWQVRANIGTVLDPDWLYADKGEYWAFTTTLATP